MLHTWGEDLRYHPHIHVVLMAGGLTKLHQWQGSSKKFFIPVKVLSQKFRGKYLHYLQQYFRQGLLNLGHGDAQGFQDLLDECYARDWYSYCKPPFDGPPAVIRYLGRYIQRIAIANSRIVSVDEQTVTFTVRDKKNAKDTKTLTLPGVEFIRRFLKHVLPPGFVKVRYYGLLAARNKKTKLALCRKLTASPVYKPRFAGLKTMAIVCLLLGRDVTLCPVCQVGQLKVTSYQGASP